MTGLDCLAALALELQAHDRRDHDPGDEDEPAAEHLAAMRRRHRERLASHGLGRLELRPEAYA